MYSETNLFSFYQTCIDNIVKFYLKTKIRLLYLLLCIVFATEAAMEVLTWNNIWNNLMQLQEEKNS